MEALADKEHKQGEHIPQHSSISSLHYVAVNIDIVPTSVSLPLMQGWLCEMSNVVECLCTFLFVFLFAIPTFDQFLLETFKFLFFCYCFLNTYM